MTNKLRQRVYSILFVVLSIFFFFHPDGIDVLNLKSIEVLVQQPTINLKSKDGKSVDLIEFPIGDKVAYKKIKVSFSFKADSKIDSPIPIMVDLFGTSFDPPEYNFQINSDEISSKKSEKLITFQLGEKVPSDLKVRCYTLSEHSIEITNFSVEFVNAKNSVFLLIDLLKVFLSILILGELVFLTGKKEIWLGEDNLGIGFSVSAAVTLLYCISNNSYRFYHDSLGYWTYAKLFVRDDGFSVFNYDNALRGYLFPLVNYLQISLSQLLGIDELFVFRFFSSFTFSFFIFILFPSFIKRLFDVKVLFWQRFAFYISVFIFWRGYALFPLTDIFALMFLVGSLFFLIPTGNDEINKWNYIYSGLLVAAAVNLRPSYILVLGFVFVLCLRALIIDWRNRQKTKVGVKLSLWLLGVCLIWYPQFKINEKHFEVASPFVPMEKFFQGKNLMLSKLYNGLTIQKYETYIGNKHNASVILNIDSTGSDIINAENLIEFKSYGHFFSILLKYPVSFVKMYLRHLFNGLDIMFNTPYVDNFESPMKYVTQILNVTVWFLFIAAVWKIWNCKGVSVFRRYVISFCGALVIIVPTIVSIPTEPEIRFFMPVYFLAYITVILQFEVWKEIFVKKNLLRTLGGYIIFLSIFCWYSWLLGQNIRFD